MKWIDFLLRNTVTDAIKNSTMVGQCRCSTRTAFAWSVQKKKEKRRTMKKLERQTTKKSEKETTTTKELEEKRQRNKVCSLCAHLVPDNL